MSYPYPQLKLPPFRWSSGLGSDPKVHEWIRTLTSLQLDTHFDLRSLADQGPTDVLDIAYAPSVPASTPGGMRTEELFEAVNRAGTHPHVQAMDIVCLDPYRDVAQATIKAGVHVMLTFLSGSVQRKRAKK